MELENGMVSGAMPYNQSDAPPRPKPSSAPWCKRAVDGETVEVWPAGKWFAQGLFQSRSWQYVAG